jgi:ABC-2 type transport system permease protein/sodium transport system permease protein
VRLALKELRETLRDRRTIATLLLMPILVYPLLSVAFERFLMSNMKAVPGHSDYVLGLRTQADAEKLGHYIYRGVTLLREREKAGRHGATMPSKNATPSLKPPNQTQAKHKPSSAPSADAFTPAPVLYDLVPDPIQSIAEGRVDVAIDIKKMEPFPPQGGIDGSIDCELFFDPQSPASRDALRWLEGCLNAVNQQSLEHQLRAKGVKSRVVPVQSLSRPVEASAEANRRAGSPSLATLVPLILMTITGAVYPAIDLTAGERERGTLETLIASPVPRMQLLLAKYAAVVTVALLTAVVNLAAMVATVSSIGLGKVLFGDAGVSLKTLAEIIGLLVLFAAFFSAVLLAVTSFARSFKEAQAYLIPLMLLSFAPGMLSMIPGIKLQGPIVVAPLLNIVLLARDLLEPGSSVDPATAVWVVLSTALFAVAAIGVAARIFGTDAVLYGSHGTWSDLLHRPYRSSPAPTPTSALLCLAVMFPAYFLASNLLARSSLVSIDGRLILAALVTVLIFLQIPLAAAVLNRVDLASGFQLRPAGPIVFAGAFVLGISLWPFAHEALVLLNRWDFVTFDDRALEAARQLVDKIRGVSPILVVGALAVVPAMCEEFFFRGYLLSALERSMSGTRAVLLSSLLFGLFHLVAIEQLHFERLIPSTCLGLVLGWVCLRSGSVLPGMLLHASHNSLLLMAAYYQERLASWGWGLDQSVNVETASLPASWLITATIGAAIGFALVALATRRRIGKSA